MVLYNLFLLLYRLLAKCTAPFNGKVKQWVLGQNEVWNEITGLAEKIQKPIIWVHCASYGEFEQGLPIIEKIKADYPGYQVWLTFFSPSGYLHRKNDPTVDFVTYLPMDSASNAKHFFDIVQPKLVIFIKYEFWFYYLSEAKKRNIPTLLVAAIFRPTQIFFKWYGNNAKIIIAGSTWEKDHILLASLAEKYTNLNWIVVPHHVDSASIQKCVTLFNNATTLTSFAASHQKFNNAKVIIVDQIGLLRNLYQHAYITYIGGGFSAEGIHNVLEPAAFGKPVFWGPNDEKYIEARGLVNAGGGFKIHDVNSFSKTLELLSSHAEKYTKACESSTNFISQNAGATQKTMEFIYENRLLIN